MRASWWQLPGPSRFIRQVTQDLQDGKNVVLCLPQHFPEGLGRAIRAQLEVYESWPWYTLALDQLGDVSPADFLYSMFVRGGLAQGLCSAATLARERAFAGRVIWLSGITAAIWPIWRQFIAEYSHACKEQPPATRTVFVLPLMGELTHGPPADDICLAVHAWQGIVSRFDMLLFTAGILPDTRLGHAVERQLMIACVANLALWDPEVAEMLIELPLASILSPHTALSEYARARSWERVPPADTSWCRGMRETIDGADELHSALCLHDAAQRRIERRIWSAQVGTLLPLVEEQRQDLLVRLRRHLAVPFVTPEGGTVADLQDLEIGHIYWQLTDLRRQGIRDTTLHLDSMIGRVNALRQIRNDLAHLKCISAERLQPLWGR